MNNVFIEKFYLKEVKTGKWAQKEKISNESVKGKEQEIIEGDLRMNDGRD